VPVLMMFGPAGFPNPNEPRGEELDRINAAWKALLVQQDPSLKGRVCQSSGVAAGEATPISSFRAE
jgi:hypothetical protein